MGLLDGKVAIVTGAGRGIGREEALLLAAEGAKVIVNDVGAGLHGEGGADPHPADEVVALITEHGGQAAVNGDDISSWEGAKHVVEQAIDTFGSLDIVVNNAGILRDKMSFNMDESDWGDVIRVHFKGHLAPSTTPPCTGAAGPRRGRRSRAASSTPPRRPASTATPARPTTAPPRPASPRSTWILARELGRYGVTSNAIAPRARTRMTENMFGGLAAVEGDAFDAWDPKNIANLVGFLAAPAAQDVNGQIFVVFGGNIYAMSALPARRPGHPRRRLDPPRADRRQGRAVQGNRLGRAEVQFLLSRGGQPHDE